MRKKNNSYDKINTLIGRDVTIEGGTLKSSETVRIDGTYIGDIICQGNVCIGQTGVVKGNLKAKNVLIGGKVEGNVESEEEIHLSDTCIMVGDLKCNNFVVDEGANFDGNCKMATVNSQPSTIKSPTKSEKNK